jgi:hypothetical protein
MPPETFSAPAGPLADENDPLVSTQASGSKLSSNSIQVDNKIYSAEQLAQYHPGGELFVRVFAGVDATEAFLSYHRRAFPHAKVSLPPLLLVRLQGQS